MTQVHFPWFIAVHGNSSLNRIIDNEFVSYLQSITCQWSGTLSMPYWNDQPTAGFAAAALHKNRYEHVSNFIVKISSPTNFKRLMSEQNPWNSCMFGSSVSLCRLYTIRVTMFYMNSYCWWLGHWHCKENFRSSSFAQTHILSYVALNPPKLTNALNLHKFQGF